MKTIWSRDNICWGPDFLIALAESCPKRESICGGTTPSSPGPSGYFPTDLIYLEGSVLRILLISTRGTTPRVCLAFSSSCAAS